MRKPVQPSAIFSLTVEQRELLTHYARLSVKGRNTIMDFAPNHVKGACSHVFSARHSSPFVRALNIALGGVLCTCLAPRSHKI